MLCSACQSIFRGPLNFTEHTYSATEQRDHHLTAQSLAQAIRQNCHICSASFQQYQGDKASTLGPERLLEGIESTGYYISTEDHPRLTLCLYWWGANITRYNYSRYSLVEADFSEETCRFASNTASEPCWNLAKEWFSSCLTNHIRCTKNLSATPYHPTRVIEVSPLASLSDDELHLRIDGEHSPEVPYMTLSHCWGKSAFLQLTKTTSQRLRDGFSRADTMSKTFQDAITVCQEFGIRYLWIDSLCIFQDSIEDWRCEAALMGQVYGNSVCNIAATQASNDEEGCFRDRDASLLQPCIIKSEWDYRCNRTWKIIHHRFWDTRMNQAPLNQRGWVMRERWLSPRVLHYGRDQILWECSELDACEAYPDGLPRPLRDRLSGFKLGREFLEHLAYFEKDMATPYNLWHSIVEKYSVTSLTKGDDRLVAISGIARRMRGLLDDEYLAGPWRKSLPSQLLWQVHSELVTELHHTRPTPYRAPSWSWASVDQRVRFMPEHNGDSLITILDAGVTPIGPDSTGQIKDGFIRLNGWIFPAKLRRDPVLQGTHVKLRMNYDDLPALCFLDTQFRAIGTLTVYILPILYYLVEKEKALHGLILQAAAQGNGTYERLGAYSIYGIKFDPRFYTYKDKSLYENGDGETIVLI